MGKINKENFKKKDIDRYKKLNDKVILLELEPPQEVIKILSIEEEVKNITLPTYLFYLAIAKHKPLYLKYFPFTISLKKFTRDEYWRKHSNYMGVFTGGEPELELYLAPDVEHSVVSLLWILLHEFRHKIQSLNKNINSNLRNDNYENWVKYNIDKGINLDKFFHVFHEILPFEIDANTFACELLEIDYPGSKFNLTKESLKMLNE